MEKKFVKQPSKPENHRRGDVRVNWSTIKGVQKLELAKLNVFPTVRRQLYDVLVTEFGDLADFIIGNQLIYPPAPDLQEITEEFDQLDAMEVRNLYLKAVEKYYLKRDTLHENLKRIYGKIMSICDDNLHDRLYRLPDFAEVRQQKDAVKLWTMISSMVCDDGADGDLDERKFRALNKYNNRMGATESLLTFYESSDYYLIIVIC